MNSSLTQFLPFPPSCPRPHERYPVLVQELRFVCTSAHAGLLIIVVLFILSLGFVWHRVVVNPRVPPAPLLLSFHHPP